MIRRPLLLVAVLLLAGAPPLGAAARAAAPAAAPANPRVVVTMASGKSFTLELWPADAPRTVESFLSLVRQGFYDGQRVHRLERRFVVQWGDPRSRDLPLGDRRLGTGGPGYTVKAEFNKRPFDRGVLGLARSEDPDSGGSQVFIMLGSAYQLNGHYTAFGKVVRGMDVVDDIALGDRIDSIKVAP
jgi:peptidyl-prolyl cis-trans isomerase B (cyclophilin B)